jgi:hypothetical protein
MAWIRVLCGLCGKLVQPALRIHLISSSVRKIKMADGHGGRRAGAGRPPGTGWTAAVAQMRTAGAQRLTAIVGGSRDPLEICLSIAADDGQDTSTRLQACSIVLPFIYPKLSAASVDTRTTTVNIDAAQLLDRLDQRIERLRAPEPMPLIEAVPDDEPQDETGADAPAAEP